MSGWLDGKKEDRRISEIINSTSRFSSNPLFSAKREFILKFGKYGESSGYSRIVFGTDNIGDEMIG